MSIWPAIVAIARLALGATMVRIAADAAGPAIALHAAHNPILVVPEETAAGTQRPPIRARPAGPVPPFLTSDLPDVLQADACRRRPNLIYDAGPASGPCRRRTRPRLGGPGRRTKRSAR